MALLDFSLYLLVFNMVSSVVLDEAAIIGDCDALVASPENRYTLTSDPDLKSSLTNDATDE